VVQYGVTQQVIHVVAVTPWSPVHNGREERRSSPLAQQCAKPNEMYEVALTHTHSVRMQSKH